MIARILACAGILATGSSVAAQDAASTYQLCIWSCLSGKSAGDPAYHACVDRFCGSEPAVETAPPPLADPTQVWQSGAREMGRYTASIDLPGHAGRARLLYICERGAPDRIVLEGFEGVASRILLGVGNTAEPLDFAPRDGGLSAMIPPGGRLVDTLRANPGQPLTLYTQTGTPMHNFSLNGFDAAISQARRGC